MRIVHSEIPADDPARCMKFHADVFGWTFDRWGGPAEYWMVKTGDGPGIVGWYAWRVPSLSKGLLVGFLVAAFFAFLIALAPNPDGSHYWSSLSSPSHRTLPNRSRRTGWSTRTAPVHERAAAAQA